MLSKHGEEQKQEHDQEQEQEWESFIGSSGNGLFPRSQSGAENAAGFPPGSDSHAAFKQCEIKLW